MKTRLFYFVLSVFALTISCSQGQNKSVLAPQAFADKIKAAPEGTVIDVRTPGEFATGHLAQAKNMDWNGGHFEHQVMSLDKTKPMFVYCLKGGRSASAAEAMRSMGFKEVYELEGGIEKWQAAKLPLTKE